MAKKKKVARLNDDYRSILFESEIKIHYQCTCTCT